MKKKQDVAVLSVEPSLGVPGGEISIHCRGFVPGLSSKVKFGEAEAPLVSASENRVVARLPDSPNCLGLSLHVDAFQSPVFPFGLATRLASDLHPVANPVAAPDGSIITTISGTRGQEIPQPLVRVTKRGDKIPYSCEIMNPTGLAFSKDGQLYISSRSDGTVLRYTDFEHLEVVAEDLGIPCGLAFDSNGFLYVGDRTGRIHRIDPSGGREEFVRLEPSISAYHLIMDSEDRLYVTGPTFAMRDCLYRISRSREVEVLLHGLARPQGMAFLPDGDLLICAGFQGKKGVFRLAFKDGSLEHYIAGPIMVGLAVSGPDLFLADSHSIYRIQLPGKDPVN